MPDTQTLFLVFMLFAFALRGILGFISYPIRESAGKTQNMDLWAIAGTGAFLWAGIISVLSYFIQYI